jgi:hypothetical protein
LAQLGATEGKPVDSGFVFLKGAYLEKPYVVSRRGRTIYINNQPIYQWDRWPLPDLRVDQDPGLPQGLNETSAFEDLRDRANPMNGHSARKLRYLYQHFPADIAMQKMAEYYSQLPFVQSVTRVRPDCPDILRIRTKSGKEILCGITQGPPDSAFSWRFTNKDLVQSLNQGRLQYENRLKMGDCYFLFGNCEQISLGTRKAARDLGLIVQVLRSPRPKEEKVALLQRMEFLPPPSRGRLQRFDALLDNFQAPPSLEERIAELVKQSGLVPRRLEDIPQEIPSEREMRLIDKGTQGEQGPEKR